MRKNHIMTDEEFLEFMDGETIESVMCKTQVPVLLAEDGNHHTLPAPVEGGDS